MIDKKIGDFCSGCEACASICPSKSITMRPNDKGFMIPHVDNDSCINCSLCISRCPVLNFSNNHKDIYDKKTSYAFKSNNEYYRSICSSGAVFLELSSHFIKGGAVVYGAAFNEEYELLHCRATNFDELIRLAGSKYLQSRIYDIYHNVKNDLDNEKTVLFFGLSCQVEGLKAYLNRNYERLFCVDLICMGVPSPLIWSKYVETYYDRSNIKNINFKDKRLGWHKFSVTITNNDNSCISVPGFDNAYMECMFKGYSLRESCFKCCYKCESKISDITIADCWGCENYVKELDDNMGLSMVITHSDKGVDLLNILSEIGELKEFDYENVLKYNSNYNSCVKKRFGRSFFYFLMSISPKLAFRIMGKNPNNSILRRISYRVKKGIKKI